ncbi:MFS general substrate transporter [Linderina pennispora]|uniref:MFS general substrate transporter n=1 Tax=Linderina pennispora TaxID=61395 RepID=A0A1Y1WBG6_9FUNG|nr:MFS general substrate transporter [Linderina pennispora]ORX70586.1 MFS general substrate transporter [Linderina pennispora]
MSTRGQRYRLRTLAMLGACLSTTTAGTVYLFSTYGPALSHKLRLTSTQSNVVAISANYGLLLSGPFFGWAADTVGPKSRCTAFSALAYTFDGTLGLPNWIVLAGYMVLVGLAAQAANMAAVTTTTKNFKQNRGSAVSLCIAFFGLSPFVLSHFLSYLGLTASTLGALMLSVVGFGPSRFRRDPNDSASVASDFFSRSSEDSEDRGLLIHARSGIPKPNGANYEAVTQSLASPGQNPMPSDSEIESAVTGTPQPSSAAQATAGTTEDGVDYDTARDLGGFAYISDPEAQLLALVLFLSAGIGVFYNNNVGTIVNALYHSSTDTPEPSVAQRLINNHVATVSLASFLGRLTIGIVVDFCKRMWRVPRSGVLVFVVLNTVISQVIVGSAENLTMLWVGSAWTGLSYGFIFGFVPTLVSVWFGTKYFGSNWGLTSASIGFSGQALGAFFGFIYDSKCA